MTLHDESRYEMRQVAANVKRRIENERSTVPFTCKARIAEARQYIRAAKTKVRGMHNADPERYSPLVDVAGLLESALIELDHATRRPGVVEMGNETPAGGNDGGSEKKNTKAPTV